MNMGDDADACKVTRISFMSIENDRGIMQLVYPQMPVTHSHSRIHSDTPASLSPRKSMMATLNLEPKSKVQYVENNPISFVTAVTIHHIATNQWSQSHWILNMQTNLQILRRLNFGIS